MENKINEKDLEVVIGGLAAKAAEGTTVPTKYAKDQKVLFVNPNNENEILEGKIFAVDPCADAEGYPHYIILVSESEMQAQQNVGRRYNVSEKLIDKAYEK